MVPVCFSESVLVCNFCLQLVSTSLFVVVASASLASHARHKHIPTPAGKYASKHARRQARTHVSEQARAQVHTLLLWLLKLLSLPLLLLMLSLRLLLQSLLLLLRPTLCALSFGSEGESHMEGL